MSQLFNTKPQQSETRFPPSLASHEQASFWRKQLQGMNHATALSASLNNTNKDEDGPNKDSILLMLEGHKIGAFAKKNQVAGETIIIGAWAYLLSCYNTEQQALFGVRFPDASTPTGTLWPMCITVPLEQTVVNWLKELQESLEDLQQEKPVSLLDLHLWLDIPASEQLVESVLDFDLAETSFLYPLQFRPDLNAQSLEIQFQRNYFSGKSADRLSKQLQCVIHTMLSDPQRTLASLDILPAEERTQVLIKWNSTAIEYPRINNLKEFFEQQVERTPDGIAVEFESSTSKAGRLSYRELNAKANQIAHYLRQNGIGSESIVGICAERSIELTIGVLGIIKAGAAYVPFDPGYPKDRLEFMITDTNAPIILTQKQLRDTLPKTGAKVLCLDSDWHLFAKESILNERVDTNHDHLAYLIYTSGSTGKPKGVAMRQGPLINLLQWQIGHFSFTPAARTLQFASINFDVSFQELFSTWCAGGTLVLISEEERRDSKALVQFLHRNRVERLFLPFVALKHLANAAARMEMFPERLREVITAGEQLQITPELIELFKKLPKCTLENQYGPSETHVVTACRMQGTPDRWPPLPSIGKPIANTQIYILNRNLHPIPAGVAGELFIGGDCLARGYLNRPELTAEKFIPNPFIKNAQARLYKTGDLARFLPDGNIEFLGRIDHQVKIRGFRIELGEIEALLSQHPGVREAVATAHGSADSEKQLVAYVVPRNGSVKSAELRQYLKNLVPPYAVPSVFVSLPELPLTPNGKVDRRALPAPAETESLDSPEQLQMPRDPLEMQITLVFEKFFKQRPIGIDVSFFEIGGDSLQALKLVLELERVTGKEIPLSILYQASTIESLAKIIREKSGQSEFSSLVPLQPLGSKPPLYLIHTTPGDVLGYGNLIYHLHDQPCYGLQSLGMHQVELAHKTVPEMAAYYVKLIREHQPHGPYFLGGWCYGGIIAVEMAQQLLAAGEKVGPLILIETPAPAPSLKNPFYFLRRIGCALNMTVGQWKDYLQAKIRYYRGIRMEQEKRYKRVEVQDERNLDEIEKHNKFLAKMECLYHVNITALNHYHSRVYPGKIVLFNAAEQDPAVIHDPLYGWPGLAREIQAHIIPGDHDSILMEPHVRTLAQKLAECLHE